jgi:TolB-like protein
MQLNNVDNKIETQPVNLAVLPFDNLTGNIEQDYFSRGFVEDLIADLSRFQNLEIISSNTILALNQKKNIDLSLSQKLNVQYVLKGNLRKFGDKLRINTQLVNAHNNRILWAEKYDAHLDSIFEIHDNIIGELVNSISEQLKISIPSPVIKKQETKVEAYDYWLHGLEYLRQGSIVNDEKARDLFKKALEIDPNYGRAYSGLSLSYFNEWSCQLWEYWDKNMQMAFEYATKALEYEDRDHVVYMVLGKIFSFRRQFELAEEHFNKSLHLNPNDADSLAFICGSKALLGDHDEGMKLFNKARKLNPYHENWYFIYGIMAYFLTRQFEEIVKFVKDIPETISVDFPGYLAAVYAYLGDLEKAKYYKRLFDKTFEEKITYGRKAGPGEGLRWILLVNPFKREEDLDFFKNGLLKAGFSDEIGKSVTIYENENEEINIFKNEQETWQMSFAGTTVQIPTIKGFVDIAILLSQPTQEIHCNNLMGSPLSYDAGEDVLDEKAQQEYKQRITDLQEQLQEAEEMNDLGRTETISNELDQLVEHLSKSLGLRGKSRKLGSTSEKARSAVTWRIRNAIKKIENVHPKLAKHLSKSIHTGTFCSYSPEKETFWQL